MPGTVDASLESTMKAKLPTIAAISALLRSLKPQISDEYRCTDDPDDTLPGMQVTVGASPNGTWHYQTGDNSYSGVGGPVREVVSRSRGPGHCLRGRGTGRMPGTTMKKPTLETAGNLLVPVDGSGTAVGMPWTPESCPYCGRPYETFDAVPIRHPQRYADALQILARLTREAQMFRDTGRGREHLTNALIDARRVLEGGAL